MSKRLIKIDQPEYLYPYSPVAKPMPVPPVTDVCEGDCVCVTFSCSLVPYVLGALEIWRWKDSFKGTEEEKSNAVGVMRDLMGVFGMAAKNCGCPDDSVVLHRINPDTGVVEIGNPDTGTWSDDPTSPYVQAIILPPLKGATGTVKQCEAANNVIENMKDLQHKYSDMIGTLEGFSDLIFQIIVQGVAMLFLPVIGVALVALLQPLIAKALQTARVLSGTTKTQYDAMFTNAVWTDALCILYCNCSTSGTYNQTDWSIIVGQLKQKLGSSDTSPGAALASMVDVWALVGLNNAARAGAGVEGNCDDCACVDEWWYEFDFRVSSGSEHGWAENGSEWVAGEGWGSGDYGCNNADICDMIVLDKRTSNPDSLLTGFIIEFSPENVGNFYYSVYHGGDGAFLNYNNVPSGTLDAHDVFIETPSALYISPLWGGGNYGRMFYRRIVLHGTGSNPFGADNYIYIEGNP